MNWRRYLPKILVGAALSWLVVVGQAQASNIWTYEGSGDGHTITGFLDLNIGSPVGTDTNFDLSNVINSEFTITGPNFLGGGVATNTIPLDGSFTFDHSMLFNVMGFITPPNNVGCVGDISKGCYLAYVGGTFLQFLSATIFNGNDWQVNASLLSEGLGAQQNAPGGGIVGEFILSGTGQWTSPGGGPSPSPSPTPEPGTLLLLGSGLVGLVGWQMKKRNQ